MELDQRRRTSSAIEDIDISDTKHCLLCYNDLVFIALGPCGHKNLCNICSLRLRMVIKDKTCPICKQENNQLLIIDDKKIDQSIFSSNLDETFVQDEEDQGVFYLNPKCAKNSLRLRYKVCTHPNCEQNQRFANVDGLCKHMVQYHQRTFCKICLKGRLVFIGEQKFYHVKRLRQHIEEGDVGGKTGVEILPHPWCNFCECYFYNDASLNNHLQKVHLTCHLCGEAYKHFFYDNYKSLQTHFDQTHFLCQDGICKAQNYIAFKTPEELTWHEVTIHRKQEQSKTEDAQSYILGFEHLHEETKSLKCDTKFKDKEAIDFSWYFSNHYAVHKQRREQNQNKHNRRHKQYSEKEHKQIKKPHGNDKPIREQYNTEDQIDIAFTYFKTYIKEILERQEEMMSYQMPQSQIYQMYMIIFRQEVEQLAEFNFIMNFGVTTNSKKILQSALNQSKGFPAFAK